LQRRQATDVTVPFHRTPGPAAMLRLSRTEVRIPLPIPEAVGPDGSATLAKTRYSVTTAELLVESCPVLTLTAPGK